MVTRWAVVLLALAGCDRLFGLDHFPEIHDGSVVGNGDADGNVTGDAEPDSGAVCAAINNDEDGDGLDDACDPCPTVNPNGGDTDDDGLPDNCDPDLGAANQDQIVYWNTLSRQSDGLDFAPSGTVGHATTNKGTLVLSNSSSVTKTLSLTPTEIEIKTSSVGQGANAVLSISNGSNIVCTVTGYSCDGLTATKTCLRGNGSAELETSASSIRTVRVLGTSSLNCSIEPVVAANGAKVGTLLGWSPTTFKISTNASSTIIIDSFVIYASK